MYRIDAKHNIYLSRGDDFSFSYPVRLSKDSETIKFNSTDNCALDFYLFYPNSLNYEYVLRKTFRTDGITIVNVCGESKSRTTFSKNVMDDRGNIIIHIDSKDTMRIAPGQYKYQIRVQLYDPKTEDIKIKTITNRYDFFVIEDDLSNRVW